MRPVSTDASGGHPETSRRRPLIFAHRGSCDIHPEHTLRAYQRALESGADGVECDVRMTRDGHLVCVHDRRLDRTSNGRGRVSRRTLGELDELNFSSWHPGGDDTPGVLSLDRLIDALKETGRQVELLIETKHPTTWGGAIERELARTLRRHGLAERGPEVPVRVTVMSFSLLAIRRMRALTPALPTVLLLEIVPPGLRGGRLPAGTHIGGPSIGMLRSRPDIVRRLHARGHQVYVWTVNEAADLDLARELGVEGVISDRPRFARERLGTP